MLMKSGGTELEQGFCLTPFAYWMRHCLLDTFVIWKVPADPEMTWWNWKFWVEMPVHAAPYTYP